MSPVISKIKNCDFLLFIMLIIALMMGLVQVYSSSFVLGVDQYSDGLYFFRKQLIFTLLGLGLLFVIILLPQKYIYPFVLSLFLGSFFGVILSLYSPLGVKVGGAYRWLNLFWGIRFEPSEVLKVGYIGSVAYFMSFYKTVEWKLHKGFIAFVFFAAPLFFLVLQPDFGSFAVIGLVSLLLFFCFFDRWLWVLGASAGFVSLLAGLIYFKSYRYERIMSFLDPWADPQGSGFQIIQSLLSFRSGGFWGQGLGQGRGKLYFLPEAHTDFTLAVFVEENGFVFFSLLIFFIGVLISRMYQISMKQVKIEFKILGFGLSFLFTYSVFLNIAVNLGLLPTKGLSLPFLSYGGSSLLCQILSFGILLNLSRSTNKI